MSAKPISDKDRARIRAGMERLQSLQWQAGAAKSATVEFNEDHGVNVPLGDLDGLVDAYIEALPELDANQTPVEWRKDAGATMAIVEDKQRSTAVIMVDAATQCPECSDFDLTEDGLRLRIDDASWGEGEGRTSALLDPLSPTYADRFEDHDDGIFRVAGLASSIGAAGGLCWLAEYAPAEMIRVQGIVTLAESLVFGSQQYRDIGFAASSSAPLEWVGVAHLFKLAELGRTPSADGKGRFSETARTLSACGYDWTLLASLGQLASAPTDAAFVVPGFLAAGAVTLVAGAAGTGKSTLLHDLAIMVATPRSERDPGQRWLGVPSSDIACGKVAFLSGEDTAPFVIARRQQLRNGPKPGNLLEVPPRGGATLAELLKPLKRLGELQLLIVDAARSFMQGSEDESAPADAFMAPLVQFAADTGCGVAVIHHLKKGMSPASPAGVLEAIRGSQVFVDRPRVIIGLTKRRESLSAAVIKSNIPTSFSMNTASQSFRMDALTLRAEPMVDGSREMERPVVSADGEMEAMEAVVVAIARAHASGRAMKKSGKKHGVYESALPGLEKMSRAAIHRAVDSAISTKRLKVLPNRTIVPAGGPFPMFPTAHSSRSGTGMANAGV